MKRGFIRDPYLVLYLPLHKLDGGSIRSEDAYGHSATVTGALWTPQGHSFDGTDDFIDLGNSPVFDITVSLTIELWMNPTSSGSSVYRTMLAKRAVGGACNYELFLMADAGANQGRLSWFSGGVDLVNTTYIPVVGTWTHVVATVSGASLLIYTNGVQVGSATIIALAANTGILALGKPGSYTGAEWFIGLIGETRIYNRVLSPVEIQRNYLATRWKYR